MISFFILFNLVLNTLFFVNFSVVTCTYHFYSWKKVCLTPQSVICWLCKIYIYRPTLIVFFIEFEKWKKLRFQHVFFKKIYKCKLFSYAQFNYGFWIYCVIYAQCNPWSIINQQFWILVFETICRPSFMLKFRVSIFALIIFPSLNNLEDTS